MRRLLHDGLFALLCVLAVAMAAVLVLVMSGRLVSDPAAEPAPRVRAAPTPEHPAAARSAASGTKAAAVKTTKTTTAAPAKTTLVVTAARGDSWMEVRRASSKGKVLFSGILAQGDAQTFSARRLWLRLGAAGNVDLAVDGKAYPLPSGTPELTLPA
jgi:cytoskeletal protein RodZ